MLKKLKSQHVILVLAALGLMYALSNYASEKSVSRDSMTASQATYLPYKQRKADVANSGPASCCVNTGGKPQPSQPF